MLQLLLRCVANVNVSIQISCLCLNRPDDVVIQLIAKCLSVI